MHVNAITFERETPLTVWWVLSSRDGEGRVLAQQVAKTVGYDPLVYSGTLTPFDGIEVPDRYIVGRSAGGLGPVKVLSSPPAGWAGQLVLLSARLQELKQQGIYLPGTDGKPDPFSMPKKVVTTNDRLLAIESTLGRLLDAIRDLTAAVGAKHEP